jgi:putative sterol carrier protein
MNTSTVEKYVQAMAQGLRTDKAGGLNITYHLQLTGEGGGSWAVSVANQACRVSQGAPSRADTSIAMSTDRYVKLANGQLNALEAYNKGEIKVGGNTDYARKFIEIFPPWGSRVPPESPPATPPAQPPAPPQPQPAPPGPALADYVRAMPRGFQANKAGGLRVVYQFVLAGTGGGTWTVTIANGTCSASEGQTAPPSVTVRMSRTDFIQLAQGKLNATQAYSQGKVKVSGDLGLAARIPELFKPWAEFVQVGAPPEPAPKPAPEPKPSVPAEPSQPKPPPAIPEPLPPAAKLSPVNIRFEQYSPIGRIYKEGFVEAVATGWSALVLDSKSGKLHYMDTYTFAGFTARYYGGGVPERIEGHNSQVIWSTKKFTAGVYQRVAGARVGQDYGVEIGMLSFYRGPGGIRGVDRIVKRVGIDPTGGTDAEAAHVVWGDSDGRDNEWSFPRAAARAQSTTLTIFALFDSLDDTDGIDINSTYLDAGVMDRAPMAQISVPGEAAPGFTVRWGGTPHGELFDWRLEGFDVRVREDDGDWKSWQKCTSSTSAAFSQAKSGHRYTFRVRAWQKGGDTGNRRLPSVWEASQPVQVR